MLALDTTTTTTAGDVTTDVLHHHLMSFAEGDLDALLSDYAPEAVFFTPNGPLNGVDALRPLFRALLAEFAKPGAAFRMNQWFVHDHYAYILWNAQTPDNLYDLGTDTFVVRHGKIVAQSFTARITPKA